jgi:hypothetical protein
VWPFKKPEPVKVWTQKELEHMGKCARMLRYISGTHMLPENRAARFKAAERRKQRALKRLGGALPSAKQRVHRGEVDDSISYEPSVQLHQLRIRDHAKKSKIPLENGCK